MYQHIYDSERQVTPGVGSFTDNRDGGFKEQFKATVESFRNNYQIDILSDMKQVLNVAPLYEAYKEAMFNDALEATSESSFATYGHNNNDEYVAMHSDKMDQYIENTRQTLLTEASSVGLIEPIVGLTMPILKKQYIANQFKDMLQTIVSTSPIVKYAYERRFLKNKKGEKKYFPECFYDGSYYEFTDQGIGKEVTNKWYPQAGGTLPLFDLNILEESGGSLEQRDALSYDFGIKAIKMEIPVPAAAGTGTTMETIVVDNLDIRPDYANNTFKYTLEIENKVNPTQAPNKVQVFGSYSPYDGLVTVSAAVDPSTNITIKGIQFGGHLSNANNNETIELDKERHNQQITIAEKERFNAGLTLEKIKDEKALANIDVTVEVVSDMSDVCAQTADSNTQRFLEQSFQKVKNMGNRVFQPMGYNFQFADEVSFDMAAPSTYMVPESEWRSKQLRYYLGRMISYIKTKLRDERIMIAISANSYVVELLNATDDDIRWVLNSDSNIGGVKLDYKFGVMTVDGTRVHIIASQKETVEKGFRITVIPLTDTVITYRRYEYSFNIETNYRNALTPLTPNIMCVQRYENIEVLPVQSCLYIKQYRERNLGLAPNAVYSSLSASHI